LAVQVPDSNLAVAGEIELVVQNPAPSGFFSNAMVFAVENPLPTLISVNLDRNGSGGTLTVIGQDFVAGAVVLWNGEERTTHFISSTELHTI